MSYSKVKVLVTFEEHGSPPNNEIKMILSNQLGTISSNNILCVSEMDCKDPIFEILEKYNEFKDLQSIYECYPHNSLYALSFVLDILISYDNKIYHKTEFNKDVTKMVDSLLYLLGIEINIFSIIDISTIDKYEKTLKTVFNLIIDKFRIIYPLDGIILFEEFIIKNTSYLKRCEESERIRSILRNFRDIAIIEKIKTNITPDIKLVVIHFGFNHFKNLVKLIESDDKLCSHEYNSTIIMTIQIFEMLRNTTSETILDINHLYQGIIRVHNLKKIKLLNECSNTECQKIGNLYCSKCKTCVYCSKDCQKENWKLHKKICKVCK
jgi:hypothetical protein